MSLQVNDPRSRGRSRSPSGRTRDRSTSRDPRMEPTRSSKTYLSAEPSDDKARTRSRSRGASPLRGYRKTSRHDSDSEHETSHRARDSYTRARPDRDHYYHSDSGGDKRSSQRYSQPPQRRSGQFDTYSDEDIYSDSDDDLAYGDDHGGGYYGYKGSASKPGQKPVMTGALHPGATPRGSAEAVSGYSKYAPGYTSGPPPISSSAWAPVPDCEKPGFVPPSSQAGDSMPGAFPTATTAPPTTQYMTSAPPVTYAQHAPPVTSQYAPPVTTANHQRTPSGDPNLYANPPAYQYAQIDPNVRYSTKPATSTTYAAPSKPKETPYSGVRYTTAPQYSTTATSGPERQYVEIAPGSRSSGRPHSLSVSSLGVGGYDSNAPPPASPLLEAYKGTYQSISPMPSPILIAPRDDDISDLEPLDHSSDSERRRRRKSKKTSSKDDGLKEPK
ncbi:hypothetical protein BDV06DRAFT_229394, partial [Aspergillus oleicola]